MRLIQQTHVQKQKIMRGISKLAEITNAKLIEI